jgi:cytochrome c oxidase assembly protein subunit 15
MSFQRNTIRRADKAPVNTPLFKASLIALCFMILGMVLIGGATRLTGSGLSIVDWKPVTGFIPPLTAEDWLMEFRKYQASPEFQKINFGMTVEDFKSIFYLEYIHRLWGRLIGLVLLIPTFLMIFKRQHQDLKHFLGILWGLGLAQGVMGWLMVKSGLSQDPHVSAYRLSAHLALGFMIFGVALWMTLRLYQEKLMRIKKIRHSRGGGNPGDSCYYQILASSPRARSANRGPRKSIQCSKHLLGSRLRGNDEFFFRPLGDGARERLLALRWISLLALLFVFLTALLGALVAGLQAGLVYNTFPLMGDHFIPRELLTQSPWWRDLLENPVSVQFLHRCFAMATTLVCGGLWVYQRQCDVSPPLSLAFQGMLVVLFLQVSLGILTLLFHVPLVFALLHQGVAFLLFGSLVYVVFLLSTSRKSLNVLPQEKLKA